ISRMAAGAGWHGREGPRATPGTWPPERRVGHRWSPRPRLRPPLQPRLGPGCATERGAPPGSWQALGFDGQDGRQIAHDSGPGITAVSRRVDLSAGGAKVHAAWLQSIHGHGVTQDIDVTVFLRQALG